MPSASFKHFVISVAGAFPGYKQGNQILSSQQLKFYHQWANFRTKADLKAIIESRGATWSPGVTSGCTHLITTQREINNHNTKYVQATKVYNCNIVSVNWLVDSHEANKPLPEKAYLFGTKSDDEDSGDEKKKRTLEEALDLTDDRANKKPKDAQKANSKAINVPVDEGCSLKAVRSVHIDDSGLIWDATLNQTVSGKNSNKFYRIQILVDKSGSDFKTWTRWGRVGEHGQSALLGDGSLETSEAEFKKKFKDKSGLTWENRLDAPKKGKYTFIERNYEEDSDSDDEEDEKKAVTKEKRPEPESSLSVPVQDLISFIFNPAHFQSVMASMSYDAQKLPLGKLSKRTLRMGFQYLKDLSELISNPRSANRKYGTSFVTATEDLSNQYFTVIPHVFGRHRPPVLNTDAQIKKEIELLEALTDMEVANDIMKESRDEDTIHQLDRQFQSLGLQEMTALDHKSTEFSELSSYLLQSRGSTHHYRYNIVNIFRIERNGEEDRFQNSPYSTRNPSNRRLLWHGSRSTNYGGILSQGLRIAPPEAPVSGYMFGKGVYFADMSTKSAGYCCSSSSANMGLLLLCDVELGDPMHELDHSSYNAGEEAKQVGKIATLGRGSSVPADWKDAGCVHPDLKGVQMPNVTEGSKSVTANCLYYNEYIVYDVSQIRQRYLFQVHMG
ncbi:poly polymerase [Aspergillus steynii IBT 23096]|uniref:Poly [ADP-ribose] polymerase n=1 Tax=Aspergillus steynii IBT 23096 TaxID=1392250 RepID=A0A2I2GML0_9EURO|nr:poly polymerase [Aspergillus steynii IBT 23096]PLB54116.1 poly polymerase [Aspergillus steynii IBT 23096]